MIIYFSHYIAVKSLRRHAAGARAVEKTGEKKVIYLHSHRAGMPFGIGKTLLPWLGAVTIVKDN
ncbi:MAG: hypothetical protein MJA83_15050 [Gammaproteobacteria bacterium]|nr:hypothetical protein [Gammaproteobacteria bacterium]